MYKIRHICGRLYGAFAFEIGLFTVRQEDKCKNSPGTRSRLIVWKSQDQKHLYLQY